MAETAYAQWLQSASRLTVAVDAAAALKWGAIAEDLTASSAIAFETAATAEAQRQLDFRKVPIVEEQITLPKMYDIAALRGRVWTVKIVGDAAYQGGADVFVLGGVADHTTGVTSLNVLRRT